MLLEQLVVLALVQGITEFLPISSSGHLVLVPCLTGWTDQGQTMDIAVHVGTLAAVILYFRQDVAAMTIGGLRLLTGRWDRDARLALQVVAATIPIMVAGVAIHEFVPSRFRSVDIIIATTIGFGILMWLVDRRMPAGRAVDDLGLRGALFIGMAQALSLVPGTSRSGITMTAGRALGMSRIEAARFSLFLSIPAILGAGAVATLDVIEAEDFNLGVDAAIAAGLAFVSALIAIAAMMRWLKHASFTPFVIYRIALGALLLALIYVWDFGPQCAPPG